MQLKKREKEAFKDKVFENLQKIEQDKEEEWLRR